ncbi:hypothetical protein ACXA45_12085 [Neomicrococcus lactis]
MPHRREKNAFEISNASSSASKSSRFFLRPKQLWFLLISVLVVVALVVGMSVLPGFFRTEQPTNSASEWLSILDPDLDSDSDGIPDQAELSGWKVSDGSVYATDPFKTDSDDDGLSDREEAGDLVAASDGATAYTGLSNPTDNDSDDDGLQDNAEVYGWSVQSGEKYFTNPMISDSDSDGLIDSDEAGELLESESSAAVYTGYSNPHVLDTDDDGLNDSQEADSSSDPHASDSDSDGLSDLQEVTLVGTDPTVWDTDADGFNDGFEKENRVAKGLDPLFEDVEVSAWDYAGEFAKGALAGEAWPSESIAWLAGNLIAGGASFIPGVGWIVGSAADLRDAVALAIRSDWVGAGFSIAGLLPVAGDSTTVPSRVQKFVSLYPNHSEKVGGLVQSLKNVPNHLKMAVARSLWRDWDYLVGAGADEDGLLKLLTSARMSPDSISSGMKRPGHISGTASVFLSGGLAGERALSTFLQHQGQKVQNQVRFSTTGCIDACNRNARIVDSLSDGVAHESKVGYVSLTPMIRKQIASDAYLRGTRQIKGAHWHFYPSDHTNQVGPSSQVIDELEKSDIPFTVHLAITK